MKLEWTEIPEQPYNTLEAATPFGVYRLEWKGWKDYDNTDIQFCGEHIEDAFGWDVEGAKERASEDYMQRMFKAQPEYLLASREQEVKTDPPKETQ